MIAASINNQYTVSQQVIDKERSEIAAAMSDPSAFGVLYERYYERIFLFVFSRVADQPTAGDLTAQTFIQALSKIKSYQHKGLPFSSWLFRIAANEVNMYYRKTGKQRTVSVESAQLASIIEEPSLDQDRMPLLVQALDQLSDDEVELIEMKYFEKRSYQEIGEIKALTVANAKVRVHRIVNKLKQIVKTL